MIGFCCALVLMAAATDSTAPAIEADGEHITITAATVMLRRGGESSVASPVMTSADLDGAIEGAVIGCTDGIEEERRERADGMATLAQTLERARAEIATLRADAVERESQTRATIQALAAALDARLPPTNATCSPYVLENGRTLGHQDHVSPGAVRTLRCDPGFVLNGSSAWPDVSVICNSDGSWSDNGRTQCTRVPATGSPSTPPTRSPVNYEEVTCIIQAGNTAYSFWADGTRLRDYAAGHDPTTMRPWPGRRRHLVKFASTAAVFGLNARNNLCGCSCGGYVFVACGTPSGEGAWNFATPGLGSSHGNEHAASSGRMTMFSQDYDQLWPSWSGIGGFDGGRYPLVNGTFTQPQFDSAAAGFEAARGSISTGFRSYNNSMVADQRAPTIPSDYFSTVGTVCGGPDHDRSLPDRGMLWLFRYDSRARI